MKRIICLALCLFLTTTASFATNKHNDTLPTLAPILKKAMPAIVNIAVQGLMPSIPAVSEQENPEDGPPSRQQVIPGKPRKFQSIGSGVIIDPKNGVVITNDHVIRNAQIITVTLNDGRRLKAKLIGSDSETDVAVLQIEAKDLHSLPIGDSDAIEVGDFVVAIGNPFGLNSFGNSQSATFGIISAMKRSDLNIEGIENFIQTDAAINPGNSGGALINAKGELIGINTAIISLHGGNVGIGFAIPINMVQDIARQIMQYGSVHRGLMGIFVQHLTPELAQAMGYQDDTQGALVAQVNQGSPAEAAGLKSGDIITKINDSIITQASQVKTVISLLRVGGEANIYIKRDGKDIKINAIVTDVRKNEQKLQAKNPFLYGLALHNFEQDSPPHGHIVGVQIVGASENSAGWRAGLRPGDVVIKADNKPVTSTEELQKIAQANKKQQLLVQILRGAGALYILIV